MLGKLLPALAALTLGLGFAGPAFAAQEGEEAHDHHHHHEHGTATLTLDEGGKKWTTDATLRGAMETIRKELAASIDAIHHDKFTDAQYKKLAETVNTQLLLIVEKCELPPAADAQFHILLADMFSAVSTLKAESGQKGGAVKLLGSLKTYPEYFEHPGWTPIKH